MKAKLIKVNDNQPDGGFYILRDLNGDPIALEGNLSLKNCQAIERGYDLDGLAEEYAEENAKDNNISYHNLYVPLEYAYRHGFQKCLELMGDKKYSEDDMIRFMQFIISQETLDNASSVSTVTAKYYLDNFQSLQQTEFDVEIVTENVCGRCYSNNTNECWSTKECSDGKYDYPKPLLDADGCLILKTFKSE